MLPSPAAPVFPKPLTLKPVQVVKSVRPRITDAETQQLFASCLASPLRFGPWELEGRSVLLGGATCSMQGIRLLMFVWGMA